MMEANYILEIIRLIIIGLIVVLLGGIIGVCMGECYLYVRNKKIKVGCSSC